MTSAPRFHHEVLPQRMVDFHAHLWGDVDGLHPRPGNAKTLHAVLDRFSLAAMVVLPLFGGHTPSPKQIHAGNRAAAALAREDSRFRPFATIHPPHGPAAVDELRRALEEDGFFGAKVWVSPADAPDLFPLVELLIDCRKPLLIHALHKSSGQYPSESDPAQVAALAQRYPEATIVMAHIGGNFLYGCEAIRDVPNVSTDCSGTFCEQGMVEHAVAQLGADRVLFGTDTPGADFINNLAKVQAADLPDPVKDKILYQNAWRLFA